MVRISKSITEMHFSPIRDDVRKISDAEKKTHIIRLDIGDSDFVPKIKFKKFRLPEDVKYTASSGYLPLRKLIAKEYKKYGLTYENIGITEASSPALLYSILGSLDPSDESVGGGILVPTPGFSSYETYVKIAKGKLVPLECRFDNEFKLPPKNAIDETISREAESGNRINAIILTSPSNPTGYVIGAREYESIAELAEVHDMIVISDGAYKKIKFINAPSPFEIDGLKERLIECLTFSKTYGFSGGRVGSFATQNSELSDYLFKVLDATSSRPGMSQNAAIQIMERYDDKFLLRQSEIFEKRAETAAREFSKINGVEFVKPGGSFYFYVRIPGIDTSDFFDFVFSDDYIQTHRNVTSFIPGRAFYFGTFNKCDEIRFALVKGRETIKDGIEIFGKQLKDYKTHQRCLK